MKGITTETIQLVVDVKISYDKRAMRRELLNWIKKDLGIEVSSCGQNGWGAAKTIKTRELKQEQINEPEHR